MTLNDAVERTNNNAVLGALAKVAMFLTPIIVTVGLFVIGGYINATAKTLDTLAVRLDNAQSSLQTQLQTSQTNSDGRFATVEAVTVALGNRIGNIESRISVVGPSRDAFQRETQAAIKEMTSAISSLALDVATTKRDVGYLRDFAEEQKRSAKGLDP